MERSINHVNKPPQGCHVKPSNCQKLSLKFPRNPDVGLIVAAGQDEQVVGMANLLYSVSTALGDRVALLIEILINSGNKLK